MNSKIVSPKEWLEARVSLLAKEKQLTRLHDELAEQRTQLPWVRVDQQYEFEGPHGKVSLSELFGDKTQLAVWHFMLGPGWKEGCPSRRAAARGCSRAPALLGCTRALTRGARPKPGRA